MTSPCARHCEPRPGRSSRVVRRRASRQLVQLVPSPRRAREHPPVGATAAGASAAVRVDQDSRRRSRPARAENRGGRGERGEIGLGGIGEGNRELGDLLAGERQAVGAGARDRRRRRDRGRGFARSPGATLDRTGRELVAAHPARRRVAAGAVFEAPPTTVRAHRPRQRGAARPCWRHSGQSGERCGDERSGSG